ncbi:MAG: caspase family protein [Acidobacteriia bacterium]|nr:caspase family protein [Terriglobia bacterium]
MLKALIIGIDDYKQNPLSSAVNDAVAFRDEIITSGIAKDTEIELFTSPPQAGSTPANSKAITDWLYENVYIQGDRLQRFIFYYAGHGILAYSDAAHTHARTALVPSDVEDLKRDGKLLIDFNGLLDTLSLTGPDEQLYFIDACRDMPYEQQPDVTSLGWSGKPPGAERSQAAIYAVSPLGKARGSRNGMGVMTTYLREALRGEGLALEYDTERFQYTVNMRSICEHAREKVRQTLRNEPAWVQKYQLPSPGFRGPKPQPLLTFDRVNPAPLTVHMEPEEAATQIQVKFCVGNYDLAAEYCYPINRNHETVHLQPQRHLMIATSSLGIPEPSREPVDVRVTNQITIRLPKGPPLEPGGGGPAPPAPSMVPDSGVLPGCVQVAPSAPGRGGTMGEAPGSVEAAAMEPQVEITLESLAPPYQSWKAAQHLTESVPPGSYSVQFRLGPDVFCQQEIFVRSGEQVTVNPTAAVTPLLMEAVPVAAAAPPFLEVSESIGPMQAALLPTILPIIGIKPFDFANKLFHQITGMIPTIKPGPFENRPLSVVLALDGNFWSVPIAQILSGIRCSAISMNGGRREELPHLLPVSGRDAFGFDRLFRSIITAPLGSFVLTLTSEVLGEFTLASAGLPNRATVITGIFRPDGTVDISQNLLQLPDMHYRMEESPPIDNYGRVLRTLEIGQALYRSGELFQHAVRSADQSSSLLMEAFRAKWVDPILGCMAYYAARKALATREPFTDRLPPGILQQVAGNLFKHFPDLPDSRVIHELAFGRMEPQFPPDLISGSSLPLLAESVWELAHYARTTGREGTQEDAPVAALARSIVPEQPWLRVPMLLDGLLPARAAASI